jgi:hypothetical protein
MVGGCGKKETEDEAKTEDKTDKVKSRKARKGDKDDGKQTDTRDTGDKGKAAGNGDLNPVKLSKAPSAEEKKNAAELAKKLTDRSTRSKELRNKENSRLFLILAATSKDPKIVHHALMGMHRTFGRGKAEIDADYLAVTAARLKAKKHEVLAPALRAARKAVRYKKTSDALFENLTAIVSAKDDPAVRFAALKAVSKPALKKPAMAKAVLGALDADEPYVVVQALLALKHGPGEKTPQAEAFKKKITALLKHKDPGVRGEACAALAAFVPFRDEAKAAEIGKKIMPLLEDKHPFVKSRAGTSLARIKYKPAVHAIVKQLDDKRKNTYDIRKFKTVWGRSGYLHLDGSAWSRVDDAMLYSLRSMTFFDKKIKFTYKVNSKTVEKDIAKAVADAKKWYKKNKSSFAAKTEKK